MNQLTTHRRRRQLPQHLLLIPRTGTHTNLLNLIDRHRTRPPQTLDNRLRAHPLLHKLFHLLQNLARKDHNRGGSIAHLSVLGARDVGQDARCGVHDVQEFHHGGAVVGDGLAAIGVDEEQIAAVGAEGGFYGGLHGEARVDV